MRAHPVIPSKSSIWITYPGQINLAIAVNLWLIANQKFSFLIYCLRFRSLKELTYGNFLPCMLNLSRFFTVQLSRFCICTRLFIRYIRRRILLFLCCPLSHDSFYIIASCFAFVNNFFHFFKLLKAVFRGQLVYNSMVSMGCQHLFYIFRVLFSILIFCSFMPHHFRCSVTFPTWFFWGRQNLLSVSGAYFRFIFLVFLSPLGR